MLSVKFSEKAIAELQLFVRNYEASFLKLYEDTGLQNEHLIKNLYIKSAEEIDITIRSIVLEKLSKNQVLGRKKYGGMLEIDFYVGSRLIIVLFSDDKESDTRWIESIFIDKKPIIF